MPQPADSYDADFDAQLQGLFQQAERAMSHRSGAAEQAPSVEVPAEIESDAGESNPSAAASPSDKTASPFPTFLKPLTQGLASIAKATAENNALLKRMDPASLEIAETQKGILKLMADLRAIVEARNTVSRNMFSALHEELQGYKDGFLLQTVHRPIIRDLITLYDDISELHRQLTEIGPESSHSSKGKSEVNAIMKRVNQVTTNMANNMEFILEVLARLEVTVMPPGPEKLDKLTQKAVNLEPAKSPEEDGTIVRSVRRGFLWKDAVFRPEEVVIKRWKDSPAADAPSAGKQ
jgi:molecular chaperone GrpE (heat shock protein)